MESLGQILAWIDKYGLPLIMFIVAVLAWGKGWVRSPREVTREREISDSKDTVILALTGELKAQTVTLNRMADGIEERNRIERELRGRRT